MYYTPDSDGTYCLSVQQKTLGPGSSSVLPSWVQLQSYIGPSLEHSTTSHGITTPAETKNAGALAVGAAHWNDTDTIYTRSSRGPLPDSTIKPDIVGAHFVETSTYGEGSSGTSFASPHVAGLAALVKQVYSSRSPSAVANYLKDNAHGRDTVPNNTWGYGFAHLPDPPSTDATLSALTLSDVDIGTFSLETASYSASVGNDVTQTTVTPTPNDPGAGYVIKVGGVRDADGTVALAVGENVITIEVTAEDQTSTETYTVAITRQADPCGAPIDADTTIESSWDDTCLSERDAPGGAGDRYARFYTFSLDEPADVVISLSSDEDTFLYLLDGHGKDGTTLHENDDIVSGNLNSRLSVSLQPGDYTIESTTYNAGTEGDFTLTVEGLPGGQEAEAEPEPEQEPCEKSVTSDGTIAGSWDDSCLSEKDALSGEGDRYARFYTLTLAEASDLTITLTSDEDTYLYLLDGHGKDGDTLHENDDIASGGVNLNSRLSVNLQAGDYTVEATNYYAEKSGDFTLEIEGLGEGSSTQSDLEVGTPSVDDANPATGATFTLSATVTNSGNAESPATTLRFYRSVNTTISGSDTEVGTDEVGALAADGTSDQSIEVTAPSTAGTYYYGACVDSVTNESETSDNCSTAVRVPVLQSQGSPDLTVGILSVDDASPTTGAAFTLSATVTNEGDGGSTGTTLRYYQSTDATITNDDTEVGTDSVGELAASGTSDQSINLTAPSTAGTYYFGACVDAVTGESDTTDNCSAAVKVDVEASATGPDLVVETPSVDDTSPDAGATFTLSVTITNAGAAESAATTLRYYRSADGTISSDDTEVGSDSVGALAASGTSEQSIDLTAPSTAGTYYYGACVDSITDESDTTDNCSSAVAVDVEEPTKGPDLEVETPSVDDASPETGGTFTLSATVRNSGDEESAATTLRYYKSTDAAITTSDTEVGTDSVVAIAVSGTSDQSIDLTAPTDAGTYYYGVCVDSVSGESDSTDNCSASVKVIVVEAEQEQQGSPDLEVGTPSVSDSSLEPGAKFTLSATVTNAGDGESASTTLRYYRSADTTISTADTEVGTDAVGALAATGTSAESVSLTAPSTVGAYYYGACVDSVTDESDTTDNCSSSVTVDVEDSTPTPPPRTAQPDLQVGTPSVTESSPATGETFALSATVINLGDEASAATTLRYYRSADATITTSDTEVGTDSVEALAPIATSDQSVDLTAPSTAGTYYYGACVDAVSSESNTANNCSAALTVTVLETEEQTQGSPNLSVTASLSKTDLETDESFTIAATVSNTGDGASDMLMLRYFRGGTRTTALAFYTKVSFSSVGVLEARASTDLTRTLTAPTSGGTFYYMACVTRSGASDSSVIGCSSPVQVAVLENEATATGNPDLGYWNTFLLSKPDYSTRTSSLSVSPGADFWLYPIVQNNGDLTSPSTTLRYYRSTDSTITTSDTEVATYSVMVLAAGGGRDRFSSKKLTAPSTADTYYYGACVDSVRRETNTANNCSAAMTLEVVDPNATSEPDLEVGKPSLSDTRTWPGENITISVTVTNKGDTAAEATTLRYYRSTDADITSSDTEVGTASVGALAADGTSEHSIVLVSPRVSGPQYHFGACVDVVTDETRVVNNCSQGTRVFVQSAFGTIPHLPSVSDSSPRVGAAFTLSVWLTRQASAGPSSYRPTVRYYRSTDWIIKTSDTQVGSETVRMPVAGSGYEQSFSLTAPTTAGTYYYGVCIDPIPPDTRPNNCSPGGVKVTVTEGPNLEVSTPTVNDAKPDTSATFTLSATVTNAGDAESEATTLRYYRSTDETVSTSDTQVGTDVVGTLGAAGTSAQSISLTAPSTGGTYYYGACVDSVSEETDTTDNCSSSVKVAVQGPPDLTILPSMGWSIPLVPGGSFWLQARLKNEGTGESAATTLRFYQSDDSTVTTDDTQIATKEVPAIASGEVTFKMVDLTVPSTVGTYYYGICVDAVSKESDTTNNCTFEFAIDLVVPEPAPDLTVGTGLSIVHGTLAPGTAVTLSALVLNEGAEDAEATTLRYYRSIDQTISSADTLLGTEEIEALDSADSSEHSLDITAPLKPGSYHFGACVDTVTDELDTADNCSFGVWMGVSAPDLTVGTPSVNKASPATGAAFTLSATVTNSGDRNAAATTLRYYRSTDSTITTGDTAVGTDSVGALTEDGTSDQSISLTAPSTAGTYYYGACVDTVTYEYDTDDNCSASVKVVATAPNLKVRTPSVDDSTPDAGASFTLSATVTNAGDRAAVATTLRYYQSDDATITSADTAVGTDSVGALAAAGTSNQSIDLTAPSDAGTYYYGACVDSVTDESDTTDNCSASVSIEVE